MFGVMVLMWMLKCDSLCVIGSVIDIMLFLLVVYVIWLIWFL